MPLGYDLGVQCPRPSGEAHGHAVAAHALYRAGAEYRVPHVGTNGRDALHIHRRQGCPRGGRDRAAACGFHIGALAVPGSSWCCLTAWPSARPLWLFSYTHLTLPTILLV